jgi:hypothetical protein
MQGSKQFNESGYLYFYDEPGPDQEHRRLCELILFYQTLQKQKATFN